MHTKIVNMQKISLSYAKYWRISLADSELGKGAFTRKEAAVFESHTPPELERGFVTLEKVVTYFDSESLEVETVDVTIRPKVFLARYEHGKPRVFGSPDVVTPIVCAATLDRKGRLFPRALQPFVPRDILEPLDRGFFSIGNVTALDQWLQKNEWVRKTIDESLPEVEFEKQRIECWVAYLQHCQEMLADVSQNWSAVTADFDLDEKWLMVKDADVNGAGKNIIALYDHIHQYEPHVPLFENYCSPVSAVDEPCHASEDSFSDRLGHASDAYPLADAQRDALTHQLKSKVGEILAINGPPGTGKTTLVLSVVADLWVRAALEGKDPPVIIAASTNNQAVTNIIDAFAKDFSTGVGAFSGRWLPDVKSFGAYFSSQARENVVGDKYQTKAFFERIENPQYFDNAKQAYMAAAHLAFPGEKFTTPQKIVDNFQLLIREASNRLQSIRSAWQRLSDLQHSVAEVLGPLPTETVAKLENSLEEARNRYQTAKRLQSQLNQYFSKESWIYALLSWIPAVAETRVSKVRDFYMKIGGVDLPNIYESSLNEIKREIIYRISQDLIEFERCQAARDQSQEILADRDAAQISWYQVVQPLVSDGKALPQSLIECDKLLDTSLRFTNFLYATHYWEGRWLLNIERILNDLSSEKRKTGRKSVIARWHRRMMLTPCVVSTFYVLPRDFHCKRHNGGHEFLDDYLYDFADLLIVDEAGQVLPEVAGASFSLAKKSMVIGDNLQIEPIWKIPTKVDVGNLYASDLIHLNGNDSVQSQYEKISKSGKTSASGSVMTISQKVSRYHYDKDLARGLFLYEHRRCYDEIVAYCNRLCYHNKLIPKRGSGAHEKNGWLPPMGYLHINGKCEQQRGGSRFNLLEAQTIAAWLVKHKSEIEQRYEKELHEVVGVVTPFGGQVRAIVDACQQQGIVAGRHSDGLTVGTVHSLQGAERHIVIFSPAYSKHADGPFIDRSPSMLNVAVSRAKDSFLVFGDMEIFDPLDVGRPRGLLGDYLFSQANNALDFLPLPRKDIPILKDRFSTLVNSEQHDEFLRSVLNTATSEVNIASPWLRKNNTEKSGILSAIVAAVKRGVAVTVFSDQGKNTNMSAKNALASWDEMADALDKAGAKLVNIGNLHSKLVMKDRDILCIGSYNWLSAARQGKYVDHETSFVYSGPKVASEALAILKDLV